jgi:photosystem II stability/assembly factor-like uncharacterized protein
MARPLLLAAIALAFIIGIFGANGAQLGTDDRELAEADRVAERAAQFYAERAYPFTAIPPGARLHALAQMKKITMLQPLDAGSIRQWRELGPSFVPNGQPLDSDKSPRIAISGRATAVTIDPNDNQTIYLGAAQGGVWRSSDAGVSWQPLTDSLPSLAVGSLAIDPRDSNVIFVGTGEANFSMDSYYGAGVFKTTDGGGIWLPTGALPTRASIANITIDPGNSQTIYLAVSSPSALVPDDMGGIFKSTDGGNNWQRLLTGIGTDLSINPVKPSDLVAALGDFRGAKENGIYRSIDAGVSWQLINALPSGESTGRIRLSRSISSPNIIYASIANNNSAGGIINLYSSIDGGNSWAVVTNAPDYCGNQCFYNNFIALSPTDPSIVYLGGTALFRSTDGGATFINISDAQQPGPGLHADNHGIAFDPSDDKRIYVVNDGGIFCSANLGDKWTPLNKGLATLQFQSVASDPVNSQRAIGGTQDNGTLLYNGSPTWTTIDLSDGGETAIDPNSPNTLYHFYYSLWFLRSDNGGQSFALKINGLPIGSGGFSLERALFYAPLALDRNASQTLYTGATSLYRTTNRGELWNSISPDLTNGVGAISAIAIAPSDSNVIYVGSSDGNLARSGDNGASWQSIAAGLPNRFVKRLAVDAADAQTAYVTFSGFGSGHIFKTIDGGQHWLDISDNLPDIPVNGIALDANIPGTIYLGTDIGVFISRTGQGDWRALNAGLPNVAVFQLDLNRKTGQLIAATHGRGMFALPLDGVDDTTPPTVSVLSPQGGEAFVANQLATISWQAQDDVAIASQDIVLSLDSGATYSNVIVSGLSAQARSFQWQVNDIATTHARIQVVARDGAGNVGAGSSGSDFTIISYPRPIITGVEFQTAGNGKLLVFGSNFMVGDSVIEINGRQLEKTKYPKKFTMPNGSLTRLQGIDSQLKQLLMSGQQATIDVFNKSAGRRSLPFSFTPQ